LQPWRFSGQKNAKTLMFDCAALGANCHPCSANAKEVGSLKTVENLGKSIKKAIKWNFTSASS